MFGALQPPCRHQQLVPKVTPFCERPFDIGTPGLSRTDGKRADALSVIPWSRGKSLLWDVTCVLTVGMKYLPAVLQKPGAAAAQAEKDKNSLYQEKCAKCLHFPPFSFQRGNAVSVMGTVLSVCFGFLSDCENSIAVRKSLTLCHTSSASNRLPTFWGNLSLLFTTRLELSYHSALRETNPKLFYAAGNLSRCAMRFQRSLPL